MAFRDTKSHPSPSALGLLVPLVAACASEGVRRDTGIISWLSWPDIVTIDGRAVAKASLRVTRPQSPDAKGHVVMKISVDCFSKTANPLSLDFPTASIFRSLGVEVDMDILRDKTLHALDWHYAEWDRGMHRKLVERIQPAISWMGMDVEVRMTSGQVTRGLAKGLDDSGSLLLEVPKGMKPHRAISPARVALVKPVN